MVDTPSEPLVECEPEWLARPVSELACHIAAFYHQHTREELPLLIDAAQRLARSPGKAHAPRVTSLLALIAELREDVQTHVWAVSDLLFPLLVAHEQPAPSRGVAPESLNRLANALADEHVRIRAALAKLTEQLGTRLPDADGPCGAWNALRERLLRLRDHVLEELAFEDRCLLPRVQLIARMARTAARDLR